MSAIALLKVPAQKSSTHVDPEKCGVCRTTFIKFYHVETKPAVKLTHQDGTIHRVHAECLKKWGHPECPTCYGMVYQMDGKFTDPVEPAPTAIEQERHNKNVLKAVDVGDSDELSHLLRLNSIPKDTRAAAVLTATTRQRPNFVRTLLATGPISRISRETAFIIANQLGNIQIAKLVNPSGEIKALHKVHDLMTTPRTS